MAYFEFLRFTLAGFLNSKPTLSLPKITTTSKRIYPIWVMRHGWRFVSVSCGIIEKPNEE